MKEPTAEPNLAALEKKAYNQLLASIERHTTASRTVAPKLSAEFVYKFLDDNPKRSSAEVGAADRLAAQLRGYDTRITSLEFAVGTCRLAGPLRLIGAGNAGMERALSELNKRQPDWTDPLQTALDAFKDLQDFGDGLRAAGAHLHETNENLLARLIGVQAAARHLIDARVALLTGFARENLATSLKDLLEDLMWDAAEDSRDRAAKEIWERVSELFPEIAEELSGLGAVARLYRKVVRALEGNETRTEPDGVSALLLLAEAVDEEERKLDELTEKTDAIFKELLEESEERGERPD